MKEDDLRYRPSDSVVSSINEQRYEKIFECNLTKVDFEKLPIFSEHHDTTNITTIYFGARSERWNDALSLSGFRAGIRIRYYGGDTKDKLFILNEDEKCVLEFKTHKDGSRSNSKIRIGNDSDLTYGDIVSYFSALFNKKIDDHYKKFDKLTPILQSLIHDFDMTSIEPIGAASYERLHYIYDGFRSTIDFNIKYFISSKKDNDIIMLQEGVGKKTIVEIKSSTIDKDGVIPGEQYFIDQLGVVAQQTTRTKAKALKELLRIHSPQFVEPELYEKSSYDWEITEREIKLDADKNPKKFMNQCMESISQYGLAVGKPRENKNYQYIYDVGKSGITYMAKDLEGTKAVIKYKTPISHDKKTGTLVRYEYVEPLTEETLNKAVVFVGGDIGSEIRTSPLFCRDRLLCNVIFPHSKNVFEIYADHSYFINTQEMNDFFQVEIEYAGIIADQGEITDPTKEFIKKINKDFSFLAKIIPEQFTNFGCKLDSSTRTKYDWVSEEYFSGTDTE